MSASPDLVARLVDPRWTLARAAVDAAAAAAATWLLWEHRLALGIAVALVPPIVLAAWLALRPGAGSSAARPEAAGAQATRLVGFGLAAYAAWTAVPWLVAVGGALYVAGFVPALRAARAGGG